MAQTTNPAEGDWINIVKQRFLVHLSKTNDAARCRPVFMAISLNRKPACRLMEIPGGRKKMKSWRHRSFTQIIACFLLLSFSPTAWSTEPGQTAENGKEPCSSYGQAWVATEKSSFYPQMIELSVIEESLTFSRNEWGLRIIGEARNDSDITVGTPVIEVAVVDENGNLVKTTTATAVGIQPENHFRSDSWHILPAGEVGWFDIHLYVPEDVEIGEILFDARSYETDFVPATVPLETVGDWRIGEYGVLTATVQNTGALDLVGVSARLAIRMADGRMLGTTSAARRGERIGGYPGGLRGGAEAEISAFLSFDPEALATAEIETRLFGRVYEGSSISYGIAGVAHRAGLEGSFWRSSLSITNRSGASGNGSLSFRQAEERIDVDVEIPDGTSLYWTDVTQSLFGIEGSAAGYIQITSDVPLSITARTFNSTSAGDFGQALPVFTPTDTRDLRFTDAGVLSLVRGVQESRTNIGLVNMSDETCRANVRLYAPDGSQLVNLGNVQLNPTSWRQLNDVVPDDTDAAYATVENIDGCSIWAYASVIEELSGDPTTIEVAPEEELWLPGATGAPGGFVMGGGWAE